MAGQNVHQLAQQQDDAARRARIKTYADYGKTARAPLRAIVEQIKGTCPLDDAIAQARTRFQQQYMQLTGKPAAPEPDERYATRASNYQKAVCNLNARSQRMERAPSVEASRVASREEREMWRLSHPKKAKPTGSGAKQKAQRQRRESRKDASDQLKQHARLELETHAPQVLIVFDKWVYPGALRAYQEANKNAPAGQPLLSIEEAMWQFLGDNEGELLARIAEAATPTDAQLGAAQNAHLREQGVPSAELAAPGKVASKRGGRGTGKPRAKRASKPAAPKSKRAAAPPSKRAAAPPSKRTAAPPSKRTAAPPSKHARSDEPPPKSSRRRVAPPPESEVPFTVSGLPPTSQHGG